MKDADDIVREGRKCEREGRAREAKAEEEGSTIDVIGWVRI